MQAFEAAEDDVLKKKDKTVLMEIASAWIACAKEAERKQQSATRTNKAALM